MLYRMLTHEQYVCLKKGEDLCAADPKAEYSVEAHISNGRLQTEFISTSKSFSMMLTDRRFEDANPCAIIRIDVPETGIPGVEMIDVSTGDGLDEYNVCGKYARNMATGFREVLLKGTVPNEYCEIIAEEGALAYGYEDFPEVTEELIRKYTRSGVSLESIWRMTVKLEDFAEFFVVNQKVASQLLEMVAVLTFISDRVGNRQLKWYSTKKLEKFLEKRKGGRR